MNDIMHELIVINALAVFAVKGFAESVKYMCANGFTTLEAVHILDAYDLARNRVLAGGQP